MNAKPADQLESLGELVEVDLQELILQVSAYTSALNGH